jgi:sec-independent protein translocase protein TatC
MANSLEPTPDQPLAEDGVAAQMGFFDHLEELRNRLLRVIIALIIGLLIAGALTGPLLNYLIVPCDCELALLRPTDSVVVFFRVALMAAGIMIVPYATYELLMFILPGLTSKEQRTVLMAIPVTTGLFLLGVAFAWFVLVPTALPFLRNFQSDVFRAEWTASEYIAFLTALLFWMGVAFEMPVVMSLLGRLGLITPQTLITNWRLAVVLMTIAAAVITPTVDPFNMLLVIAPLMGLYVISIGMTAIAYRRHQASLA